VTSEAYTEADHAFRDGDTYARAKYDITRRWLGQLPRRTARPTLVHVGCGSGLFNAMAVADGFDVLAYEPDPAAFAMAQADCPHEHCRVEPVGLADVHLDTPGDVVVMHDVLEHIEDDGAAVEQLRALLAPGGTLILSVPALPALFGYHDEQLGHHRRYTRTSLRNVLESQFVITNLRYFGFTFIPVTAWFSKVKRRPYPTGTVGEHGFVGRAFELACRAEARVAAPLGTSLICEAHPLVP
jgi:2-polyprenyl-3-methyl-5-hydroxy-6-metoxy-1,4-benzoquinol methylase